MLCTTCNAKMLEITFHLPDGEYCLLQCPHQHPHAWAHDGRRVPVRELISSTASACGGHIPTRPRLRETKRHHGRSAYRFGAPLPIPLSAPPFARG